MVELQVGDQTIRYDPEATARIYASLADGLADRCGCSGCKNYLALRETIYPPQFRELLDRLGIEANKEAETVADGPLGDGLYHYGGWFFFVGDMVKAGEGIVLVRETPYFGYFFNRVGPCPKEFRGEPHLAIEFVAHFPWVAAESWK